MSGLRKYIKMVRLLIYLQILLITLKAVEVTQINWWYTFTPTIVFVGFFAGLGLLLLIFLGYIFIKLHRNDKRFWQSVNNILDNYSTMTSQEIKNSHEFIDKNEKYMGGQLVNSLRRLLSCNQSD